ncbi:hypothetical protein DPMN_068633 [Dreissena polymorpha]|uniref:Uncharacterized protein n=1 Tax=Dreissena polymorpha TaxID=45954 RepID=A0A9D4BMD2_DREPO|nr:hypothetical protein DPMN_068633 [Dreissena polymorpha]
MYVYTRTPDSFRSQTMTHKDRFDKNCDDIKQLLDVKHPLQQAYPSYPRGVARADAFDNIRRTIQSTLRQMQDTWLNNKVG